MKKLTSLFLSLIMVLTMIPAFAITASAQELSGTCGTNVKWSLDTESGILCIKSANDKSMTNFSEDNRPGWYSNRESIKTVTILGRVKNIGSYAFADCANLERINLTTTVTSVGDNAFSECSSLIFVVYADSEDKLATITVGENNDAYTEATKIVNFGSAGDGIDWSYEDGTLSIVGEGDMYDFESYEPGWKCLSADVKKVIVDNGITSLPDYTLSEMNAVESVVIPTSVSTIGCYALDCPALKELYIPANVTFIDEAAFAGVTGDMDIYYGGTADMWSSITILADGNDALNTAHFNYCQGIAGDDVYWSLEDNGELLITGTGGMYNYSDYSLAPWSQLSSSLVYINIGNGIDAVGDYSFDACDNVISVSIPASVKYIFETSFGSLPKLTEYTVASGNTSFDSENNYGALIALDTYLLLSYPQAKTAAEYTIPNSVRWINARAFANNTNVQNIVVPLTVLGIGDDAFSGCTALDSIEYQGCKNAWDNIDKGNSLDSFENLTINTQEHSYDEGSVTKNPTCTATGEFTKTCDYCGDKAVSTVDMLKHTVATDKAIPATLSSSGKTAGTHCSVCKKVLTAQKTVYKISTVKLSATSYVYDGKAKKPSVKVADANGNVLKLDKDYTVTYASGRKSVGKYAVTVKFVGAYSGSNTLYFTIKPKATSISSLKAKSKAFTAKWYKRSTQTTGYQLQIATNSKFTSGVKTYTISKYSTVSKTVSKLKGGKRYYVRVRTYKTVSGTKYYSSWSSSKSVVTKK